MVIKMPERKNYSANWAKACNMRRIAMCEQAGTGLRMMREAWRKLGHPSPTYKNDRAWKAFEFFIPELDKEVDMASDLVKAMFGGAQSEAPVGTKSALSRHQVGILRKCNNDSALVTLMEIAGRSDRTKFRHQVVSPLLEEGLIEMTIPSKPTSRLQKYRLTTKGCAWLDKDAKN